MNKKLFWVLVVFLASLLTACGGGSVTASPPPTDTPTPTPPAPPAELLGTYVKVLSSADILPPGVGQWTLTLRQDGTYELNARSPYAPLDGKYVVEGNHITFMKDQCGGSPTYLWQLTGNQLTTTDVSGDDCGARHAVMIHEVWVKAPSST